ncbi:ABC transporter permease [Labrenzia sp. 011]|uniref:ABC transporter permease n=1 Tax=Labrenzia sp. 011 TaxID=2171494 RepID=UPI000D51B610|nr:ABC transporter permease [Labrenzia sp. 011]PVB60179.1 ABC transporter permease [Labrenzia sp. 011]
MVYLRIVLQYAAVLAVALSLNFALPRIAPGEPIDFLLPEDVLVNMSPEEHAQVMREFGLDLPLGTQFSNYVSGVFSGDLGTSVSFGMPVWDVVLSRLPWTLLLMGWALAISAIVGSVLGVAAARLKGGKLDIMSLVGVMFLGSAPPFWIAMLLITLFSAHLGWLPSYGAAPLTAMPGSWEWVSGVALRLIMPVTALTLFQTANILLTARSAMTIALGQDYITFARAKGASENRIFTAHAFRNACLPIYTNIMIGIGNLVGGALVIETVFSYPGIGSLIVEGVGARDYNLLQGVFLLATMSVVLANLAADLGYPLLDPRARQA